jgi:mannose-6-phosphate isomerase-like protein (cupin superfamily)
MVSGQAFFVSRGAGQSTRVPQPTTQYKALGSDTGDAYTFGEHRLAIDFPIHVHDREDESIYVLDGALTAVVGEDSFSLGTGDFLFMPKGVPHSLTNGSDPAARFVFVSAPGGFEHLMDDFIEAMINGHGPDSHQWREIEERYGLTFL